MTHFKFISFAAIAAITLSLSLSSCSKDNYTPEPMYQYGDETKSSVSQYGQEAEATAAADEALQVYVTGIKSLSASYELAGTPEATYVYPKEAYLGYGIIEVNATLKDGKTSNLFEIENFDADKLIIYDNSGKNLEYSIYDDIRVYAAPDTWGGTATVTISYEGISTSIANVKYAPALQSVTFAVKDCGKSATVSLYRHGYEFNAGSVTDYYGTTPYVTMEVEKQYKGADFTVTAVNLAGSSKEIAKSWCFENGSTIYHNNREEYAFLWKGYYDYKNILVIEGKAENYY